jgi:hypothetical protein
MKVEEEMSEVKAQLQRLQTTLAQNAAQAQPQLADSAPPKAKKFFSWR